ncbi:hypothetical protein [Pseudomonas viridiflava]|nr:hypothetical protein [Pseudomonas viridiflava]MEE4652808.1 hypothetical protein [Pseudomonas alliivorans]
MNADEIKSMPFAAPRNRTSKKRGAVKNDYSSDNDLPVPFPYCFG